MTLNLEFSPDQARSFRQLMLNASMSLQEEIPLIEDLLANLEKEITTLKEGKQEVPKLSTERVTELKQHIEMAKAQHNISSVLFKRMDPNPTIILPGMNSSLFPTPHQPGKKLIIS